MALGCAAIALARGGALDRSFSGDGIKTTLIGVSSPAYTGEIDGRGRIVAAGSTFDGAGEDFALARYKTGGALDRRFSGDGIKTTSIGSGDDYVDGVAFAHKGRIVVVGGTEDGDDYDVALARYKRGGSLDRRFSGDGIKRTRIGDGDDGAYAVAIDDRGRIVVSGTAEVEGNDATLLARYKPGGSLDRSFSDDGIRTLSIGSGGDYAQSVEIDDRGRIVIAGNTFDGPDSEFMVARFKPGGSLDRSFSGDGVQTTPIGSAPATGVSSEIDRRGRIVVGGYASNGADSDFAVARYKRGGALDDSFASDGIKTTPIGAGNDFVGSLAIDRRGRIVLSGWSHNGADYDVAVARFKRGGSLDSDFSDDGIKTTAIGSANDFGSNVAIDRLNRIVVMGSTDIEGGARQFAILRYKP